MRINANFLLPATVAVEEQEWIHSPENGVDRIMLDRIGTEVARATSIVRYAPNSSFPRHEHALGEEFLVLEGVFSDEHGDYPKGTYVRNPPGSGHIPRSVPGCRILVKLRQFDPSDLKQFSMQTTDADVWPVATPNSIAKLQLHRFESERVEMWRIPRASSVSEVVPPGGQELFVVQGSVRVDQRQFAADSWLRYPAGEQVDFHAEEDTLLWLKSGHLPNGT